MTFAFPRSPIFLIGVAWRQIKSNTFTAILAGSVHPVDFGRHRRLANDR